MRSLLLSEVRPARAEDEGSKVLILTSPLGTLWGCATSGVLEAFSSEDGVATVGGIELPSTDLFLAASLASRLPRQTKRQACALAEHPAAFPVRQHQVPPPGCEVYDEEDAEAARLEHSESQTPGNECLQCPGCRARYIENEVQPAFARAVCAVLGLNPLTLAKEKSLAFSMLSHDRLGVKSGEPLPRVVF